MKTLHVVIVLSVCLASVVTAEPVSTNRSYEVQAEIALQAGVLKIRNASGWAWENVSVMLNAGLFDSGYYRRFHRVATNVVLHLPLTTFADRKGRRFDPEELMLRKVEIKASDSRGMPQRNGWTLQR